MEQTWKYLVRTAEQFPYLDEEKNLNYYGGLGWELVCIEKDRYIFKKSM